MAVCPECKQFFAVPPTDSDWWYDCPNCGYGVRMCDKCGEFAHWNLITETRDESGYLIRLCPKCVQ